MNMISTGAFQTEVDASSKQQTIAGKFAAVWEKKNARAARAGGVSLMALSLAACGSDDATTTTTTTTTTTDTTTTTTTPAAGAYDLTPDTDPIVGGAGDDAIDGSRDIVGGTRFDTLDTGDTIDGGAGTDTLTVELSGGTTVAPGSLANIEVLSLQTLAANSFINAVNSDALTTVVFTNGSAAAQVSNVQTLLSDIDVTNNNGNAVTLTYLNTAAAGTADALDIDLSGFTSAAISVTAAGGAGGYETITLSSGGSAANTISTLTVDAETTKIIVDGGMGLTVTNAIAQNVLTFDASAATGAVSLETGDSDSTVTFTGGSGNDTFDIAGAAGALSMATTLDDVLDGGAGTDTLIVDDGDVSGLTAVTAFTEISNFETLQIETALAASASVRLDRVQAGLTSLDVEAAAAGALTIGSDTSGLNVEFKAELSNGAITVDHTSSTSTSDALTIDFDRGAADTLGGTLTVTDYETVTIVIPDGALTSSGAGITLTPTTGGTATLNITGDNSLIMATSDIITADVIDASGLVMANVTDTGVTMTTETAEAASVGVTITGSNAVDVLFATAAADVISGGSGADTIHALGGQDNITLGAGADDYVIATQTTVAKVSASRDLVTDFVAGDSGDAVDYNGATGSVTTLSGSSTYGNGDSIQTVASQTSSLTVNAVAKVVNITATDVTTFSTDGAAVLDALVAGAASGTITMTSGDVALFMVSNGTDSALYLGDSDANAALVASEIALIATFTGVDNADITAANFM